MAFGFIRGKMDVKLLILYVLTRLPAPIDGESLADLVLIDGGVTYFDYKQCLAELTASGQVQLEDGLYCVTGEGRQNMDILERDLPFSVRKKAGQNLKPVAEGMRRAESILACHETDENGLTVHLALSDGIGSIFDLRLLVADEAQARRIEDNFKKNAEGFYTQFVEALSCEMGG